MLHISFGFDTIGKTVSEEKMFEYYGNKHCPEKGVNDPLGSLIFRIIDMQSYYLFPARRSKAILLWWFFRFMSCFLRKKKCAVGALCVFS